ncbi:hypothetical protein Tco_1092829 [Tanacetum coccineum]|uniref:Xylulose kinase-1 n=1 Tax=Tanacetum coccineum TaxID=301880 RepID=A0ABQ5IB08_9ASTR
MSDLKFADTHNLVTFLEKPTESERFEEIVDFLNVNPNKYALTVNPIIYYSCVKKFWDTFKAKTVNGEVQLQALVDKKKVIITESTIRRYLQLEDANGVDCLPNAAIFEQLTLMGGRKNLGSLRKRTLRFLSLVVLLNVPDENVPITSNDPLLSDEDRLKLTKLMDLCTNLQKKVLDLEKAKTAQDSEIASLKKKIKKLERRNKSRTPGLKRLRKVGSAKRVESSDEASFGDQEDASKKGRKITDIDADARQKEEEANIALIESWDNTQAMMDADYQMAYQLQVGEQEQLSIEEKSKLFIQLLEAKKKHFTEMRAREKRNKPPTQAQQRKLYCSEKRAEDSTKRAGTELEQEVAKKKGRNGYYEIMRADGSAKTYLLFSQLLKEFDREDLENLWKLVKAKHGNTRPEECYERVLWGDLKTMFERHIEDEVWRSLQRKKVLLWSFLSSSQNSSRILEVFESILLVMLMLLLYKLLLLVFRVNAAGTKLHLLTELQLLMDKD